MSVGGRIKKARVEHLGLTQRELSVKLDVNQVNISRWEREVAEPSLRYVRQIAELADLPLPWFYNEAETTTGAAA